MEGYTCPRCNYNTVYKNDFRRHLSIKKLCELKNIDIDPRDYKDILINNNVMLLFKKLEQKDKRIKELENTNKTIINNIDNSVNINQTINIYKINSFGENEPEFISDKECVDLINGLPKEDVYPEMIKLIHFNDNHPEERNIYVTSLQSKLAHTYNGEKWLLAPKKETFDSMISEASQFVNRTDKGMDISKNVKDKKFNKEIHDKLNLLAYNNKLD